jgi:hypothetical protein
MSKNELVTRQAELGSLVPGVPERATRMASWIGWHVFEIAGVTVPAVVALTVTPWWWLVSGVVGAGWTANEIRSRKAAVIQAGRDVPATVEPSTTTVPDEKSVVDDKRVGGVR